MKDEEAWAIEEKTIAKIMRNARLGSEVNDVPIEEKERKENRHANGTKKRKISQLKIEVQKISQLKEKLKKGARMKMKGKKNSISTEEDKMIDEEASKSAFQPSRDSGR